MPTLRVGIDASGARQGAREYGRAADTIKRDSREVAQGADRVRGSFARLKDGIFSVQGALAGLGAGLALRKVIGEFADFERALIGVGKTADLQGAELQRLGREVQEIARRVPVATTELLGIAQAAGQLGVKGVADITRFAETVGKLGLASDLAGEEAATSLARILTVTGTAISDVDRLGSTIVRLGNNFAATEAEIAGVATRVAQATSQFDATAADVAGIATALRAVGVEAEAGGTQVGLAFQAINDALRAGGEEMQTLERITGQAGATLREAFFGGRSTEVFKAFVDGLGRIRRSGGDVASALAELDLKGVRAVQVMGTLATRSEVLGDALGQANDEWQRNDALTREALTAATSFSAQMQLVMNAVDETAVEIGRELAPALLDATQQFRDFILEASETGQIAGIARDVGEAFQFLADNLDAVVVVAGTLVGMRLGSMFGPWGAAVGGLVGLFATLATNIDDTTEAQRDFNRLQRESAEIVGGSDGINALTKEQAENRLENAVAIREETQALIEQQVAELERRRNALEASPSLEGSARFSGLQDTDAPIVARIDALRESGTAMDGVIADLEARLEGLRSASDDAGDSIDDTNETVSASISLSEDWLDALEDAEKEVQRLSKARDDAIRGMKVENDVLRLTLEGREDQAELLEFEAEMREKLGPLYAENADQLRGLWEEQQSLNERIEAEEDARKAAEKAAEEYQRTVERATDDVVRYAGDTFADLFSDTKLSWAELWADLKQTALQTLARIAAEMVLRPIIAPIVGSVMGGLAGTAAGSALGIGAAGAVGGAGAAGAAASGGGMGFGLASLGGGIVASLQSEAIGRAFAGAAADMGLGAGAQAAAGNLGLNLGVNMAGGAIGGLLANAMGLGSGNMLVDTGTSIAGGIVGQLLIPIPGVGAAVGSFLGTALGGALGLGGSTPAGNNLTQLITRGYGPGYELRHPSVGEAGDNSMTDAVARSVMQALAEVEERAGVRLRGGDRLGMIGYTQKYDEWYIGGQQFGSGQAVAEEVVRRALSNPDLWLDSFPALREAMARGGSFSELSSRIEEVVAARQQLVQSLDAMANAANDNVTPISTLEERFEGLREEAARFNIEGAKVDAAIAGLRESANEALEREILGLTDPQQLALIQWQEWADQLRREVEAMGADMVLAEELIAQKRLDVLQRFAGGAGQQIADWLAGQQLSNTSTLSPMDRLGVAQQQFSAVIEAARAGDSSALGRVTTVADQLLTAGLDVSGRSTASFAALESMVRSTVQGLGQDLSLPGIENVAPAIDSMHVAVVRELKALREEMSKLRDENRMLRLQQAS